MYKALTEAPFGEQLKLARISSPSLGMRLQRMGLFEGSVITLHDEEIRVQPVRVRGPEGERVLGSGMASKIVVHLDDDRKFPIVEMEPGDSGHIEGITGGTALSEALDILGLHNEDRITFIRKLPPMEYVVITDKNKRISLSESMAAKIWGQSGETAMQFVSAPRGIKFHVRKILGGKKIIQFFKARDVVPECTLISETIKPATILYMNRENPLIVSSASGLRLYLKREDGAHIFVKSIRDND